LLNRAARNAPATGASRAVFLRLPASIVEDSAAAPWAGSVKRVEAVAFNAESRSFGDNAEIYKS